MKTSLLLTFFAVLALGACQGEPRASDSRQGPKGDEAVFPIGGYSGRPERDQAAGFTIGGPVYGSSDAYLAECQRIGLPCFYRVGVKIDFHGKHGPQPKQLDFEAIRAEIETQVKAVADQSSIYGWYLTKEELRHWRPLELEYLRVASEAIRSADPKKRPVWMYEPGHRTRAALEKTFPYQQIAGKGLYVNYSSRKDERIWVRWTLDQQAQAIAAANPEAIPYAVPEMFREVAEEEKPMIATWVRHDSYASLLSGVKGIVIFSLAKRKGFRSWEAYYNAYAGVARELNGPLKLGSVFLKGEELEAPRFEMLKGKPETELSAGSSGPKEAVLLPTLQSGAYGWGSEIYFFVINSSGDPVTIRLEESHPWTPLLEGQPSLEANHSTLQLPAFSVAGFKRPRL